MIGRLLLLLIAANLAWAAWSQGWLHAIGLSPRPQGEPERLARQVRPESLRIQPMPDSAAASPTEPAVSATATAAAAPLADAQPSASASAVTAPAPQVASAAPMAPSSPTEPASPPAPASSPSQAAAAGPRGVCLQAGVFDNQQIEAVRRAAVALPSGSWRIDQVSLPGRWMVYTGKLADANAVRAKRAELRALGVDSDRPGAALEPGLSLGRFPTEEAAQRGLADLSRKGVKTARVVQERRDAPAYMLRLPAADAALRQQASGSLRAALGGKEWRACE